MLYKDPEFPIWDAIRWDDNGHHGGNGLSYQEDAIEWLRVRDVYKPEDGFSLWGDNGISVQDMRQGTIGNCWFISAASSLAEDPERLMNIFYNENKHDINGISINGIYAFNFYALFFPVTVTIDDRLPLKKEKHGQLLYAKKGRDNSVWAPLFEKAFAKFHGTYEPLTAGNA